MIDAHCHIDLYSKPELILDECDKKGFSILSMTNLPSHFEKGIPFFRNRNKVRQALGMHPLHIHYHEKEFPKFINNLTKTSYIGEIGLDFSKDGISTKETQLVSFERILNAIANENKLLSIHSRKAEKEVLNLLIHYKIRNAIFHWYTGPLQLIEEIINAGYYFSINSAMIQSEQGQKIIAKIPAHYLLTETDGPFVMQNGFPSKPGEVSSVILYLANLLHISKYTTEQLIKANFLKLINRLK